jgi:site-specific DNA recombinase
MELCDRIYKLDRFSRDKYATVIHKKTLQDNGVKVLSAMEAISEGPEGIILEALLEGYERSNGHNIKSAPKCCLE